MRNRILVLALQLVLGLGVAHAAPLQTPGGGPSGDRCPDQGTQHVPGHYHYIGECKNCGLQIVTPLGTLGYQGEKCCDGRLFYPSFEKCGGGGAKPRTKCVPAPGEDIQKETGDCAQIGLPWIGLALPSWSCEWEEDGVAGKTPNKQEQPCK